MARFTKTYCFVINKLILLCIELYSEAIQMCFVKYRKHLYISVIVPLYSKRFISIYLDYLHLQYTSKVGLFFSVILPLTHSWEVNTPLTFYTNWYPKRFAYFKSVDKKGRNTALCCYVTCLSLSLSLMGRQSHKHFTTCHPVHMTNKTFECGFGFEISKNPLNDSSTRGDSLIALKSRIKESSRNVRKRHITSLYLPDIT